MAADFHRHRDAGPVEHLRGDGYAPGEVLTGRGVIAAALVATPKGQDGRHFHAAPYLGAEFAIHRYEHIFRVHGGGDAHVRCLMPEAGCVGSELPGTLQVDRLRVEGAHQRHDAVHFEQLAGVAGEGWRAGRETARCIQKLAVLDLELGNRLQPNSPSRGHPVSGADYTLATLLPPFRESGR